jgi:hypothetical protein
MFKWLANQFSPVEAVAESLDSPKSFRALIAELNAAPPDRVVRTLGERFGKIPRQGLTGRKSSRALSQLDEYAQLHLIELWGSLLTEARGQSVSDAVWDLLTSYYRKVHGSYWYCLGNYSDSNPLTAKDHAEAMILASRAMTALAKYMLLLRMRYRSAPKDVWAHVNKLVAWVERRGNSTDLVEQYPGTGITTTIERELLAILLVEVAPTANLLPAQLHALDRCLRPYAGHYSISDTYDEQARPFAYEPSRNESPRRWLKGLQVRPGARFFGIGGAYSELCKACEDAKIARSIPQWIGQTQCTIDDYHDLLQRLVAEWSPQPPRRSQLREPSPGEILVAHDWADIRRLVTFGELARSGQSLMYDTSTIHSMTNSPLRGRSEVFRDFTDEEIMLANLRSFEQSLNRDATDLWNLTDSSERGFGATAAATCAWLKVGMLVAWRRADSIEWEIAVIRRLNSTADHRLSIGMTKLPGKVHAGRLRLGVGLRDYSRSIGRSDPDLEYDALMLKDTNCTLLVPVGVVDTTCKYTLHWNKRQDIVKMERSVDCGLNFERAEISILDARRLA